jgi:hypothetical protein
LNTFSFFFFDWHYTQVHRYMMNDLKRKKNSEEKQLEKEAAKRLLLDTNLKRVFDLLAGYAIKRSLGEELELISDALKKLSSKLGSERGAHFGAVGKTTMDCRRPDHVNKCSDLLPLLVVSPLFFFCFVSSFFILLFFSFSFSSSRAPFDPRRIERENHGSDRATNRIERRVESFGQNGQNNQPR